MIRKIMAVAGVAVVLSLSAAEADAQRASTFGVSAGATLTSGNFGDQAKTGFNLGANLGFVSPMFPVGFRVDGTWHQFELEPHGTPTHEGENFRMLSLTGNALLALPIEGLSPYLIGGIGAFNTKHPDFSESENNFGYNLGAGVRFALTGFNTYAEARWTRVNTDGDNTITVIPIVFGIMF